MSSTNLWILRRPSQSLTRKPYIVPSAEVSVLGVDVDTICADSLGVAAILLLVFLSLWNQVFGLVVWIPADPVQEGKAVSHRHTNFGAKLNSSSRLASNNGPYVSLNQVHNAIRHAARLGVQQDALLAVQLADHEQFLPPMGLQARKHCTKSDQGIDSIKIALQMVELTAYCGFYLPAAWLLLFSDIEESSTSLPRS